MSDNKEKLRQLKLDAIEYAKEHRRLNRLQKLHETDKQYIRNQMKKLGVGFIDLTDENLGYLSLIKRVYSDYVESKLIEFFKTQERYHRFIHTKEYIDLQEVQEAIKNGYITEEELMPYKANSQQESLWAVDGTPEENLRYYPKNILK